MTTVERVREVFAKHYGLAESVHYWDAHRVPGESDVQVAAHALCEYLGVVTLGELVRFREHTDCGPLSTCCGDVRDHSAVR